MSLNDNRWSEKFDASAFDGEDWLSPEPRVLRDIEERIYAVPQKKALLDSGVKWLAVALIILLFSLGYYLFLLSNPNNDSVGLLHTLDEAPYSQLVEREATTPVTPTHEVVAGASNSDLENTNLDKIVLDNVQSQGSNSKLNEESSVTANSNAVGVSKGGGGRIPTIFNNQSSKPTTQVQTTASTIVAPNKKGSFGMLSSHSDKNSVVQQNLLTDLNPLAVRSFELTKSRDMNFDLPLVEIISSDTANKRRGFFTEVAWGQVAYTLNDNFNAAVSGANFFSKDGQSWMARVGYTIPMDAKFRVDVSLGYERQEFLSGHNSNVDYIVSDEVNQANSITLGMATPLGFISGEALIKRESTIDQDVTSLLLDLTNAHKIQSIDLAALLSYSLVQRESLGLTLEGGLGVKRILGVQNELLDVSLNNTAFSSQDLSITRDQEALNRTLPELTIGVQLDRRFRAARIGAFYRYKVGLSTIFSVDGSSTSYGTSQLGLRINF